MVIPTAQAENRDDDNHDKKNHDHADDYDDDDEDDAAHAGADAHDDDERDNDANLDSQRRLVPYTFRRSGSQWNPSCPDNSPSPLPPVGHARKKMGGRTMLCTSRSRRLIIQVMLGSGA